MLTHERLGDGECIDELVDAVRLVGEELIGLRSSGPSRIVRRLLGLAEDELPQPEAVEGEPSITVTSMMGAKGLQAEHVFVVRMNAPHFPDDNAAPTEHEVYCLLVALTRATRCCHLVSCKRFAHDWLQPSVSIGWLGDAVQTMTVDKSYFATV